MSDFGRRVVKVPGPKSTNSHSLKMKDPISTCCVSISLNKHPVRCLLSKCTGTENDFLT